MQVYTGNVERGAKRGRALGYPTANIPLKDGAASGVYAARVGLDDGTVRVAAVFADPARKTLEAHILDFEDDLYGRTIRVELLEKIRETEEFSDDAALKAAIAHDVAKIRGHFRL